MNFLKDESPAQLGVFFMYLCKNDMFIINR